MARSKSSRMSLQPKHRGTVVYVNQNAERTYGFISPAGSDGSRASNVWFGNTSLQDQDVEVGDEVDFVLFKIQKPDMPNKSACRLWIRKPCDRERVTTLAGEFET